ncbi:SGNH/GDSL hydrolase family protein [Candidatus Nomurabacteria bacterium]|nr:SGNH/GDSL hydrolase family protein [Candidatus Nomurabacteria bacterium]
MKKVLLLGDSIRLSYQSRVKEHLAGSAEVFGPADNCRFAKYTLWHADTWARENGKPDLIHWNNGIWDIFRINEDVGIFTEIDEYIKDLKRVLFELRKTDARIIWASTTPVNNKSKDCRNEDIDRYNAAAKSLMVSEEIEVNDLNSLIKGNIDLYIAQDNLHLTQEGQAAAAKAVSDFCRRYL